MKTKSFNKKLMVLFIALVMALTAFSFTACTSQEDIDEAVNPMSNQITEIGGDIDALETKIAQLEAALATAKDELEALEKDKLEELEIRINCLEDKHVLIDCVNNGNDTHTGTCEHCTKDITKECEYGDWTENGDGTKSKTCPTCDHTVVQRIQVTIALKEDAVLTMYWEDDLTVDLSTLLDITEGAGEITYTLTSSNGSVDGSILSCPLVSDYTISVTTAETDTHESATYTFTISVETNPNTGGFDGEWATF